MQFGCTSTVSFVPNNSTFFIYLVGWKRFLVFLFYETSVQYKHREMYVYFVAQMPNNIDIFSSKMHMQEVEGACFRLSSDCADCFATSQSVLVMSRVTFNKSKFIYFASGTISNSRHKVISIER